MSYVAAGYGITFVVLAGYTARVLRRARSINRTFTDTTQQDRPWR